MYKFILVIFGLFSISSISNIASAQNSDLVSVGQIGISQNSDYVRVRIKDNTVDMGCTRKDAVLLNRNSAIFDELYSLVITANVSSKKMVFMSEGGCFMYAGKQYPIATVGYFGAY